MLTRVSLIFIEHRINVYLRFGRPAIVRRRNSHRSQALFRPGEVFCRLHWEANEYGTTCWRMTVLQVGSPGECLQRIAGVHPGARVLLYAERDGEVRATLRQIDAIEAMNVDPADVSPDYWSALGNRLHGQGDLPEYTTERHEAWLARKMSC
ncbi:MAG: DUF2840 domain-containing protein [Betaproteobacteria bacterium]|nr:DUF2840 domain-containing protein [Betaproteobacteria bacterium]